MPQHSLHGGRGEQIRVVGERRAELVAHFGGHQGQIEGSDSLFHRNRLKRNLAELHFDAGSTQSEGREPLLVKQVSPLQDEHGLEQRCPAGVAVRRQLFHQQGNRVVLVLQSPGDHVPELLNEIRERPAVRHLAAQRNRVDEVANRAGEFRSSAPCGGRSDAQIFLPCVAVQKDLVRGQQGHEERHTQAVAQLFQLARQLLAQRDGLNRSAEGLCPGPRKIGGQVQQGDVSCQTLVPVVPESLPVRATQQLPLPADVVDVLRLQGRQDLAAGRSSVELTHLVGDHRQRPQVHHDVVRSEQEGVFLGALRKQVNTEQWALLQIETSVRLFSKSGLQRFGVTDGEIFVFKRNHTRGLDDLHRFPGPRLEPGAQHLVALHHRRKRVLQALHVDSGRDAHGVDRVEDAVRRHLVLHPHGLLPVGQRELSCGLFLAAHGHGRGGGRLLQQVRQLFCQLGNRFTLDQRSHRQTDAQRFVHAGFQLDGHDRVKSEGRDGLAGIHLLRLKTEHRGQTFPQVLFQRLPPLGRSQLQQAVGIQLRRLSFLRFSFFGTHEPAQLLLGQRLSSQPVHLQHDAALFVDHVQHSFEGAVHRAHGSESVKHRRELPGKAQPFQHTHPVRRAVQRANRKQEHVRQRFEDDGVNDVLPAFAAQLVWKRQPAQHLRFPHPDFAQQAGRVFDFDFSVAQVRVDALAVPSLGKPLLQPGEGKLGAVCGRPSRGSQGSGAHHAPVSVSAGCFARGELHLVTVPARGRNSDNQLRGFLIQPLKCFRQAKRGKLQILSRPSKVRRRRKGELRVHGRRHNRHLADPEMLQNGSLLRVKLRRENPDVDRRHLTAPQERVTGGFSSRSHPLRSTGGNPVALPTERVRWQLHLAPVVIPIKTLPVDFDSADVEPGETVGQHLPVLLLPVQGRDPDGVQLRQTATSHADQRRVRAKLYENVAAACRQFFQTRVKEHRLTDVLPPVARVRDLAFGEQLARHVGNQAEHRSAELHAGSDLLEFVQNRLHQRRVEGVRHLESAVLDAKSLELPKHFFDRFPSAGNHRVAGTVGACYRNLGRKGFENTPDLFQAGENRGHFTVFRKRLHEPAPVVNQGQRVFQVEHPGGEGSHVLADAVPRHELRLQTPRAPQLQQSVLDGEKGGLRVRRFIDQAFRAVFAPHHGQQRLAQLVRKDLVAPVQRPTEGRLRLVQLFSHPDVLRALSREQEGHARLGLLRQRTGPQICRDLAGLEVEQRLRDLLAVPGRKRQTVLEVAPPCVQCVSDIGESHLFPL